MVGLRGAREKAWGLGRGGLQGGWAGVRRPARGRVAAPLSPLPLERDSSVGWRRLSLGGHGIVERALAEGLGPFGQGSSFLLLRVKSEGIFWTVLGPLPHFCELSL